MKALPILNETKCVGDSACVMVCPTSCLEMHAGQPWLARPGDCLSCAACAAVCPTEAIDFIDEPRPLGSV